MTRNGQRRRRTAARRIVRAVEGAMTADKLDELARPPGVAEALDTAAPPVDDIAWHRHLLRRVFGLGLGFVARKRRLDATVAALGGGDPAPLAAMDDAGAEAFLADPAVIRNGRKLAAARHNAAVALAIRDTWGGVARYAEAIVADGGRPALLDDLQQRLRLVGPVSAARLTQDLGVDVLVPHPAVLRTLVRLGWLDPPYDTATTQAVATGVAPRPPGPPPTDGAAPRLARFGAALLAFATGRWTHDPVCGETPACDRCPAAEACARIGVD